MLKLTLTKEDYMNYDADLCPISSKLYDILDYVFMSEASENHCVITNSKTLRAINIEPNQEAAEVSYLSWAAMQEFYDDPMLENDDYSDEDWRACKEKYFLPLWEKYGHIEWIIG